jgi:hypothetical protein
MVADALLFCRHGRLSQNEFHLSPYKNKQGWLCHPCLFYFFGFGGLLAAGPPGLPGFVLGLGS